MYNQLFRREDFLRWIAFVGIAFAVLLAYYPALSYPPRADQVAYLAEIAHETDIWKLIKGTYDLNRHLVFGAGDELLFRPLTYVVLAVEQSLFGHSFWAWQFLSLLIHLIIVWLLLRLFWRLTTGWLAIAGAGLFALSLTNYELVTWPHLTGYLVMIIFLVLAIEQIVISCQQQELSTARLVRILIYFTLGCFFYETVNLFIVWTVVFLSLFYPKMRPRSFILLLPVILYLLLSWYNYVFINHLPLSTNFPGVSIFTSCVYSIKVILWWLYEGLFCGMYQYYTGAVRTMFYTDEVMVFKSLDINDLQVMMGIIILSAYVLLVTLNRHDISQRFKGSLLFFGMVCVYVLVIVHGRQGFPDGIESVIRINSYYIYIFWLLVLIGAYTFLGSDHKRSFSQRIIFVFVIAALLSAAGQGFKIHQMTSEYSRNTNRIILLIKMVDILITEKKNEQGFSFYVHPSYPGNYLLGKALHKNTDPGNKNYSLIEALYPQYFRPREIAKYKFLVN